MYSYSPERLYVDCREYKFKTLVLKLSIMIFARVSRLRNDLKYQSTSRYLIELKRYCADSVKIVKPVRLRLVVEVPDA